MRCVNCGAELKEGCIYCSVCGKEAQIVPDYSLLEDDYLRSLLKEETGAAQPPGRNPKTGQSPGRNPKTGQPRSGKKQMSSKVPVIIVCCLLVIGIITGVAIKLYINHKNANSYEYQVGLAEQEEVDKNHENALQYYQKALALKPDDIAVRLAMADIYMGQKEYDAAMVLLMEVITLDDTNKQAYRSLIGIYEEKEDYGSIVELAADVTDTDILELFEEYIVTAPVISPEEGEYEEYINVSIFSIDDVAIYYTLDGTEPDSENGILYDGDTGIPLEEAGDYEIAAVCVNEKGICSEMAAASYVIKILPPEYASVSPDGGRITEETLVTIEAEEDCSIYYTWDGTDPTELSDRYEEPLEIPTGNNVLSVLVVDDITGLDSGVYRTNFIYYP